MNISSKWVTHLQNKNRKKVSPTHTFCPLCNEDVPIDNEASFRTHVQNDPEKHGKWATDEDITNAYNIFVPQSPSEQPSAHRLKRKLRVAVTIDADRDTREPSLDDGDGERVQKKRSPSPGYDQGSLPHAASDIRSGGRVARPSSNLDRQPKPSSGISWTEADGYKIPQGLSVPVASSSASGQPPSNTITRQPQPPPQPNEDELFDQLSRGCLTRLTSADMPR